MVYRLRRQAIAIFTMTILCATAMTVAVAREDLANRVNNIVLVHGAFVDGSSWRSVMHHLHARGLTAVAVQNPLTSLGDDVAAVQRVIDMQEGLVILVGHSWGGAVITQAGLHPKVAGLVYVAATAPDDGQSVNDLLASSPPMPAAEHIRPIGDGFIFLTPTGMARDFAQDLPRRQSELLAASQVFMAASAFDEPVLGAAWKTKPSWYVVTSEDRALSPELQKTMARKSGARTTILPASHLVMLSQPSRVAAVIESAAADAAK